MLREIGKKSRHDLSVRPAQIGPFAIVVWLAPVKGRIEKDTLVTFSKDGCKKVSVQRSWWVEAIASCIDLDDRKRYVGKVGGCDVTARSSGHEGQEAAAGAYIQDVASRRKTSQGFLEKRGERKSGQRGRGTNSCWNPEVQPHDVTSVWEAGDRPQEGHHQSYPEVLLHFRMFSWIFMKLDSK